MNPNLTRKLIGGSSALLGLGWLCLIVAPPFMAIGTGGFEVADLLFILVIIPLLTTPGVIATLSGYGLIRQMQEKHLKRVIGVFLVVPTILISSWLDGILSGFTFGELPKSIFLLVGSLLAVTAYLFLVSFLLHHLTGLERPRHDLISKGLLSLIALQIWLVLSDVFREYAPIKEGYTHVPEAPWDLLGLIIPLGVAYGAYRIAVSKLIMKRGKKSRLPLM